MSVYNSALAEASFGAHAAATLRRAATLAAAPFAAIARSVRVRRTVGQLAELDDRTLADIGLAPGMIRRAAISAADFAYDQEMRGVSKPTFLTPAQAMNQADGFSAKRVANSNGQKKAA